MQRDDPRDRSWRGRDEDLELWGRDMDQDDWMRGTYGSGGGMPSRSGRRAWGSEWSRGPDWRQGPGYRPGAGSGFNFNRGSNWSAGWDQAPSWQRQGWQQPAGGEHFAAGAGPEPWRGDRDWSQEWWHRNAGFGWTGNPWDARGRQWHGRTPARNYQRSDERIRDDVYERLMEHPYIDTTDVEVSVSHGEVTLEGTVPDRWEKRLAEDLTESVFGVTEVHNRLRTASTPPPERGASFSASGQSTFSGSGSSSGSGRTESYPSAWSSSSSAGSSAGSRAAQLREGMSVVGLDGEQIGRVKEVRGDEFLIDRPTGRGVFAPTRFVQSTVNEQVVLTVPARQVDSMGWRSPELAS
jgi:hypothetical protein